MSNQLETPSNIKVGISIGDFNGVGLEVIIKTFSDARMLTVCKPIIYCSSKVISYYKKILDSNDFNYTVIKDASAAIGNTVNIVNSWDEEVKIEPGVDSPIAGKMAIKSLEAAVNDLRNNTIDALVTAPINKHNTHSENFKFSGHTEYLASLFSKHGHLMLLINENLRIGTVTGHIPLSEVSKTLTESLIIDKTKVLIKSLTNDFGIRKPRVAILGLNPHAGDNGLMGKEEQTIIEPAVRKLKEEGLIVNGPYPADGFFGAAKHLNYDAVLSMYHDQGLIPFKSLAFDLGVNYTAGLSVVRTSPDHGTGYDISGKNLASESSFREAVYLACDIVLQRRMNATNNQNPMKVSIQRRER